MESETVMLARSGIYQPSHLDNPLIVGVRSGNVSGGSTLLIPPTLKRGGK